MTRSTREQRADAWADRMEEAQDALSSMTRETPTPEWLRDAEREPYRIGSRIRGTATRWYVYDVRDETPAPIRTFRTRDSATAYAEWRNAERVS